MWGGKEAHGESSPIQSLPTYKRRSLGHALSQVSNSMLLPFLPLPGAVRITNRPVAGSQLMNAIIKTPDEHVQAVL